MQDFYSYRIIALLLGHRWMDVEMAINSYHNLAQQGAEALEVVVMEKTKHVLGEEHPDTLISKGVAEWRCQT